MSVNQINELEMVANLINNILGNNNQLRKESEQLFNQIKEQNPDQFTLVLLEIVKGNHFLSSSIHHSFILY